VSIVEIPFNRLEQDENGVRKLYFGITLMADSIALAGLLENLCVARKACEEERYVVKAGNRRYRALKILVERGTLADDFPVPCKVLDGDGELEAGIENIGREDMRVWEIGNHYLRCADRGMHQKEIAAAHAKSQSHVSMCIRIARDLSPKVIERLSPLGIGSGPNWQELARLAEIRDPDTYGPDTEKQIAALDKLLGEKREKKRKYNQTSRQMTHQMVERLELLQTLPIPKHAAPYLNAILQFLKGDDDEPRFPRAPRAVRPKAAVPSTRGGKRKSSGGRNASHRAPGGVASGGALGHG
jgi:ParB/RepB/Spo0J family partition protein